jgi:hypothetical protein
VSYKRVLGPNSLRSTHGQLLLGPRSVRRKKGARLNNGVVTLSDKIS